MEKGLHASTQEMADAIGMSQAALFKRFGTKENLVFAAMAPTGFPDFIESLTRGPDERPIMEQLHGLGCIIGEFFEQMIPTMNVMGHALKALLDKGDTPPPVRVMLSLSRFLRLAHDDNKLNCQRPEACATMFIGSLMQRAFLLHLNPEMPLPPIEKYVADVLSLLWSGIAPAEQKS